MPREIGYKYSDEEAEYLKLRCRTRQEYRRQARDAAYEVCIAIMRDPKSSIQQKLQAMRIMERSLKLGLIHNRKGHRKIKVDDIANKKIEPLSDELVKEIMESAGREINGHQNQA